LVEDGLADTKRLNGFFVGSTEEMLVTREREAKESA